MLARTIHSLAFGQNVVSLLLCFMLLVDSDNVV